MIWLKNRPVLEKTREFLAICQQVVNTTAVGLTQLTREVSFFNRLKSKCLNAFVEMDTTMLSEMEYIAIFPPDMERLD